MSFLNADEIAKALPAEYVGNRELESGRQLLRRMDSLAEERRSFAVETTLASRSLAPRLRDLQVAGYIVSLFYFFAPVPELCIARVATRVLRGGHDIPEAVIRRRFVAGARNFCSVYAPLADEWRVVRSTDAQSDAPVLVAEKQRKTIERIQEVDTWNRLQKIARISL